MNVGYFNDTATVTNWAISKKRMGGLRKYTNAYLPKPKYLGWVDPF